MVRKSDDEVRILFIADTHCGHIGGLNPPGYQPTAEQYGEDIYRASRKAWRTARQFVLTNQPWDYCLLVGDLIDGRQERSGGQELCISTATKQAEAAAVLPKIANAGAYAGVFGTSYHVGKMSEVEMVTAYEIQAATGKPVPMRDEQKYDCEGLVIHLRHKIARSSVVTGGDGALRRQAIDQIMATVGTKKSLPRLIVRAHAHYYRKLDGSTNGIDWTVLTLPSLQMNSKYGGKEVDGEVHWGLVGCVYNKKTEEIRWVKDVRRLESGQDVIKL